MIFNRFNIKLYKKSKAPGNRGFSLIELIISITILVLIMLPLMNSFYRSALVNKKAKNIQEQSNMAASIMEGLRNLNIEDTITQFAGQTVFNVIPVDMITDGIRILKDNAGALEEINSSGIYTPEELEALNKQDTYYFAIDGIKIGSSAYDALITMKSSTYKTAGTVILNNYPVPEAINLDIMANGVLFSDGRTSEDIDQGLPAVLDNNAYLTFSEAGDAYAHDLFEHSTLYTDYLALEEQWENDREVLVPSPTPPVEPPFDSTLYSEYYNLNNKITKTMKITVSENTTVDGKIQNTIQYGINYSCDWPVGCILESTIQNPPVSTVTYAVTIDNIYMYYQPSAFGEIIEIDNQTSNQAINFFLAYQGTDATIINSANPRVEYNRTADSLSVFTNLTKAELWIGGIESTDSINPGVLSTELKNRIFDTEIKIYKYSANVADKYQDVSFTLSSATEN